MVVIVHQASLVPSWVTARGCNMLAFNQLPRPTHPGHPPWLGTVEYWWW